MMASPLVAIFSCMQLAVFQGVEGGLPVHLPPWLWATEQKIQTYKNRLLFDAPIVNLDYDNFANETIGSPPMVIVFMMQQCGWCRKFTQRLKDMAVRFNETVRFGVVDYGAFPDLSKNYSVAGVPFVVFAQDANRRYFGPRYGELIEAWIGLQTGYGAVDVPLRELIPFTIYHIFVGGLARLLTAVDIKPTDHGSGGGPLRDGGTLGFAAIGVGSILALIVLICTYAACRRRCRGPSEPKDHLE